MGTLLIAGVLIGFNLIDEKESGVTRALAVSPLQSLEFVGAQAITVIVTSVLLTALSTLILLGTGTDYFRLMLGLLFSVGLGILLGFLIGGIAKDQLTGIATMKVLMLFMVGISMGSLATPAAFQWVYFLFPNYWVFQIFMEVFAGQSLIGYWVSCLVVLGTTGILTMALLPVLRRTLRLR